MSAFDLPITRVAISGSTSPRAPLFSSAAKEIFGLNGYGLRGYAPAPRHFLAQTTAQDFYNNAIQEIQKFDSIQARAAKIANKAARDQIIDTYGLNDPTNKDKAMYMRGALASDVANAQAYTPIAYEQGFPTHGPARGRVTKLHNFNRDFNADVTAAETQYGILPEPVVIERVVTTPAAAEDILPYVLVGGAALAALFITGVIKT
jgi:hypothetical protein